MILYDKSIIDIIELSPGVLNYGTELLKYIRSYAINRYESRNFRNEFFVMRIDPASVHVRDVCVSKTSGNIRVTVSFRCTAYVPQVGDAVNYTVLATFPMLGTAKVAVSIDGTRIGDGILRRDGEFASGSGHIVRYMYRNANFDILYYIE